MGNKLLKKKVSTIIDHNLWYNINYHVCEPGFTWEFHLGTACELGKSTCASKSLKA